MDDYHANVPDQPVIITEASSATAVPEAVTVQMRRRQRYYIYDDDNAEK